MGGRCSPARPAIFWCAACGACRCSPNTSTTQATADTFDERGLFKTGDRVTLLESGYIQFSDRDKDMLKVGGENVAASEIERVIMVTPGVREVAVVAKPHAMLDEAPVAFVIADDAASDAPEELSAAMMAACKATLADFKAPHEMRIVREMPRSTLEKVAKAELRKLVRG